MNEDVYSKLVDLYAGGELNEELEAELKAAAAHNPVLAKDMHSLRWTVEVLKESEEDPQFTEETFQRILMKLYTRGVDVQTKAPPPAHIQYHLPMTG